MTLPRRKLAPALPLASALGLGAGPLGDFETLDDKGADRLIHRALELGINVIDTAPSYGASEDRIGRVLARLSAPVRDDLIIATKGGYGVAGVEDWTPEVIERGIDQALRRLATDRIDVFLFHSCPKERLERGDLFPPLERAKAAGKIRAFGASNFKPARFAEGIAEATKHGLRFDAQQPEYNLMNRAIEAELVPLCELEGVSVLPYYGLASGYLTGKYRTEADKAKSARGGRMDGYMAGKGPAVLGVLDDVASRHKATPAQVALAWIMAKLPTGAPIASATSVEQLTELMGALNVVLSADDVSALNHASA